MASEAADRDGDAERAERLERAKRERLETAERRQQWLTSPERAKLLRGISIGAAVVAIIPVLVTVVAYAMRFSQRIGG
jgi:hypothetical protein